MRDWPLVETNYTLPMRYLVQGEGPGTVVLLHGYQDHAMSMTRRMGWLERPLPFRILAVNAPFPVPVWKADGFLEAYSWYFRDTQRDIMIVSPASSAEKVAALIGRVLGPTEPVVLLGFSQGGYLAPFVAPLVPTTRAIVAVGSGYPDEPYAHVSTAVEVYGLHGANDNRWPLESSHEAHRRLTSRGYRGEFHVIPNLDHRVDPMLSPLVEQFALANFGRTI